MYNKQYLQRYILCLVLLFFEQGAFALETETIDTKIDQLADDIAIQIPETVKYIAVIDAANGNSKKVGVTFGGYIRSRIVYRLGNVRKDIKVMENETLGLVLHEFKIEMSDFYDPKTVKKIGKFHGVDAILTVELWKFETYIQNMASLVSMEDATTILKSPKPISNEMVPKDWLDELGPIGRKNEPPKWGPDGEPRGRSIAPGEIYEFDLNAVDPDRDPLVHSVNPVLAGVILDPKTGHFSWRPTKAQHGTHILTFLVDDLHDGILTAQVTYTVNTPPKLKVNDVSIKHGQDFDFVISAQDDDDDPLTYGAKNLPEGSSLNPENGHFLCKNVGKCKFDVAFYVKDNYDGTNVETIRLIVTEPLSIFKGKIHEWISDGKIDVMVTKAESGFAGNVYFQIRNSTQQSLTIESIIARIYDDTGGYQSVQLSKESGFNMKSGEIVDKLQATSLLNPTALLLKIVKTDNDYNGLYLIDIYENKERGEWNPTYWNYIPTAEIAQQDKREDPSERASFSVIRKAITAILGERVAEIQATAWASLWDEKPLLIEVMAHTWQTLFDDEGTNGYALTETWMYIYRCRNHWLNVTVSYNHKTQARQYDDGHASGLDVEIDLGKWRIDDFDAMDILRKAGALFRSGGFRMTTWNINGEPTAAWTVPFRLADGRDFVIDAFAGDILIPLEDPMENPNTRFIKYEAIDTQSYKDDSSLKKQGNESQKLKQQIKTRTKQSGDTEQK